MTLEELRAGVASPRSSVGLPEASLAAASLGAALMARAAGASLIEKDPPGLAGLRQVVLDQSRTFLEGLAPIDAAQACRDMLGICERLVGMCRPDDRAELRTAAALLAAGVGGCLAAAGAEGRAPGIESASRELVARIMEGSR